jgi:hypothetical protein
VRDAFRFPLGLFPLDHGLEHENDLGSRMAKLETAVLEAHPASFERVALYRAWTGLPGYDPNMRRVLLRRKQCLSLVYVVPDSSTTPGGASSQWRLAPFGPGYGAPFTPALRALWDAYNAQLERRVSLEYERESSVTALLVSSDEAHRLVLLFIRLEPRDDRRFWHAREARRVE